MMSVCNEVMALAATLHRTKMDGFLVSSQGDEQHQCPPSAGLE